MFGLRCLRVKGTSMSPTVEDGDFVVAKATSSTSTYAINDVVIIKRFGEPFLIKRVKKKTAKQTYHLAGDNITSMPKVDLENVQKRLIIGKVLFRISKKGLKKL